ncbi:prephenate dehydrogenase/arogenate dehydrogenase family protein [Blastomonas sp. UPD001]|uniref:NADPH-dependent F420 reductase n=1 Tax=Blastomonas sp. UPD001 TaxID=2217673 RepID=UPI000E353DBA|nr:prephenate dehydrogenase/arogenate dehydrogenase family protein [Blastomonas sp. UPD001]
MKIGIIGAGNVGQSIGRRLAEKGHFVVVSFARSSEKLAAAAAAIGHDARVGTPGEAANAADVVVLATPWAATLDAAREIAPVVAGKVIWDTTNPLKADMSGLEIGTTTSGGEEVAKAVPTANVVKAVPPMAELMAISGPLSIEGRAPGVFVCGDDADARSVVLQLVGDLGADGVDAGPLANARYTEPLGMLLVQLAYLQGMGASIGSSLLRERAS